MTTDSDKLRTLANWFDVEDRRGTFGYDPGNEIQVDLRRIADELAALRQEVIELNETILLNVGHTMTDRDRQPEKVGWIDACALRDATMAGDRLCELGVYERHPSGIGRRWFYRRKANAGDKGEA
jgi:hypothetical protein